MIEPASQYMPKPSAVSTGQLIDSEKYQENITHSPHYYDYDRNGKLNQVKNDILGPYDRIGNTYALNNGYITDISILPYIRPQQIVVRAKNMLFNTPVSTYFDNPLMFNKSSIFGFSFLLFSKSTTVIFPELNSSTAAAM